MGGNISKHIVIKMHYWICNQENKWLCQPQKETEKQEKDRNKTEKEKNANMDIYI